MKKNNNLCLLLAIIIIVLQFITPEIQLEAKSSNCKPILYTPHNKNLFSNDIDVVKKAISSGAFINALDMPGYTALMQATNAKDIAKIKILIDAKANLNCTDRTEGNTALILAVKKNSIDIAKILLNNGANISIKNNANQTALELAEKNNFIQITELIKKQMELEKSLIKAAQEGDAKSFMSTFKQGVNIDAQDETGFTALMHAAQKISDELKDFELKNKKKLTIIRILLNKGADLNIKNNKGLTALELAKENKNTEAQKIIEAKS